MMLHWLLMGRNVTAIWIVKLRHPQQQQQRRLRPPPRQARSWAPTWCFPERHLFGKNVINSQNYYYVRHVNNCFVLINFIIDLQTFEIIESTVTSVDSGATSAGSPDSSSAALPWVSSLISSVGSDSSSACSGASSPASSSTWSDSVTCVKIWNATSYTYKT